MKTYNERVKEAINGFEFSKKSNDINALIAYAYYLGKCDGVKRVCDDAHRIFEDQKKRASESRYYNVGLEIQGNIDTIYHPDYDQWIRAFDNDETNL